MTKKRRLPYHANQQLDEIKMLSTDTERTLEPIMKKIRCNQKVPPVELAWRIGEAITNQQKVKLAVNKISVESE
jgi:hypothetical protein